MTPRDFIPLFSISALALSSCAEISSEPPASSEILDAERTQAVEESRTVRSTTSVSTSRETTRIGTMTAMPMEQFFPLQQSSEALIFDVRPAFVYAFGHVPGAISWPKSAFDSKFAHFQPRLTEASRTNRPVVLYCTDAECPDSRLVADKLSQRGHDVFVFEGGWAAWKEADLPTE